MNIPIDKSILTDLSEAVPRGGFKEIAKRTKKPKEYISRFFNGNYDITDENKVIIDIAREIIAEQAKKAAELEKEINESINSKK